MVFKYLRRKKKKAFKNLRKLDWQSNSVTGSPVGCLPGPRTSDLESSGFTQIQGCCVPGPQACCPRRSPISGPGAGHQALGTLPAHTGAPGDRWAWPLQGGSGRDIAHCRGALSSWSSSVSSSHLALLLHHRVDQMGLGGRGHSASGGEAPGLGPCSGPAPPPLPQDVCLPVLRREGCVARGPWGTCEGLAPTLTAATAAPGLPSAP